MKPNKISLVFLILYFFNITLSISKTNKINSKSQNLDYVLVIDSDTIYIDEFKTIFLKNKNSDSITKSSLDEYIDLFVNFKLKVREAESLGYDTLSSFKKELEGYRKQLAKPYLRDNDFNDNLILEAYERMKFDIDASHILIKLDKNATPEDTLSAYNKIIDIKTQIEKGKISFTEAANKYSSDLSNNKNGGSLGYFTAFMMIYEFEDIAYKTEINKISMPVRTSYGYHLIKVNDKRNAVGEVQVAHIVFKTGEGANKEKLDDAKVKIFDIFKMLNDGESFYDLAEKFSEDRSSAVKGGKLPKFGVGKMVKDFESASFNLNIQGEYSNPFQTKYGWHIVMLIEKFPVPEFESINLKIKQKINKSSRRDKSIQSLIKKLKNEYNFESFPSWKKSLKRYINEIEKGTWDGLLSKNLNSLIMRFNNKSFYLSDFVNFIIINQAKKIKVDELFNLFSNKKILDYEESILESKYPEYKSLFNEYRDGILLFDISKIHVWQKAIDDSVGLLSYYNDNKSKYIWGKRLKADIYTCKNIDVARELKKLIYKKRRNKTTIKNILKLINEGSPLNLSVNSGKFEKGDNKYIDKISWKKGFANDIRDENRFILIDVLELLDPSTKELNEIKGKIISDYQVYLDKIWISELRKKYSFSINKLTLYSILN